MEAGKRRLAGDTARAATTGEVQDLRREARALKECVADLTLENRLLKKSMIAAGRSEEHTSELQSLMRISYAAFCLKKKKKQNTPDVDTSKRTTAQQYEQNIER